MIRICETLASVYVVDTHPDDYANICQHADSAGLEPRLFRSGRAALQVDPESAPNLWVVNLNLADMSGVDLLSLLRWRYPGVPIVLVSDSGAREDEIKARCSGAEMFLSKPLQAEWLASAAGI